LVYPLSVFQSLIPPFSPVAGQFKKAFEDARDNNAKLTGAPSTAPPPYTREEKREETADSDGEDEDEDEAKGNAPAPSETNPPAGAPQDSEKTGGE
jgi:hypothetical protein